MNKPAHTPEPWAAKGIKRPIYVVDIEGRPIADCDSFCTAHESAAQQEANTRRIVACVNACAGIPTEALEGLSLIDLLGDAEEIAKRLKDTEDEARYFHNGLQVRRDLHGFYVCTDEEAEFEDSGRMSAGFDGRPHYHDAEEAIAAMRQQA